MWDTRQSNTNPVDDEESSVARSLHAIMHFNKKAKDQPIKIKDQRDNENYGH